VTLRGSPWRTADAVRGTILLGLAAALTLALFIPRAALAHHSAARFDFSIRDQMISGTVKEFSVANPHTRIVLEIEDAKGKRDIEFEGHSRNNYYRSGWRVGIVNVGDTITLNIAPTRDGSDGGYALAVITADGVRF
jgi:hypothetical protein